MKIAIDIDGTITYCPEFFKKLTNLFFNNSEIHIITARSDNYDANTIKELEELNIKYHFIYFGFDKMNYVIDKGIEIVFEDMDEFSNNMPKNVTVFKIREEFNFNWIENKWVYSDKTGINIDK